MEFLIFILVVYGFVFFAGLMLNGYILFIVGCRVERRVRSMWFLNQAMADFFFVITLPLRFILNFIQELGWAERVSSTITTFHMFSSPFLLAGFSIHCCILVARPAWAQNHWTHRLSFCMVLGAWPASVGFSFRYCDLVEYLLSPVDIKVHFPLEEGRLKTTVVIQFMVRFLIPLALIVIPTFYIIQDAMLRRRGLVQSTKPLKILFGLIPTFFICHLPYYIFSFLQISATNRLPLLNLGRIFVSFLMYFNSYLNPIFYLTMEDEFLRYRQRAHNPKTTNNSGLEPAE